MDFVIPENLYVPTPPLWIESKGFNGPLDLLWHLIRQQNIDILDIPMALIAAQYVQYISIMTNYRLEVAPDYLVMAIRLIQIKSQMLLPKKLVDEVIEDDPRALLVKQLTEYESIKARATIIDNLPRWERDCWPVRISLGCEVEPPPLPKVVWNELVHCYQKIQQLQGYKKTHEVARHYYNLSDTMHNIYAQLGDGVPRSFFRLFAHKAPKLEVVVAFQACLELVKTRQIDLTQDAWQAEFWLQAIDIA